MLRSPRRATECRHCPFVGLVAEVALAALPKTRHERNCVRPRWRARLSGFLRGRIEEIRVPAQGCAPMFAGRDRPRLAAWVSEVETPRPSRPTTGLEEP